jgi:hypothetical protein
MGFVQLRIRRRLVLPALTCAGGLVLLGMLAQPLLVAGLLPLVLADVGRGLWRTGPLVRRTIEAAATMERPTEPDHEADQVPAEYEQPERTLAGVR